MRRDGTCLVLILSAVALMGIASTRDRTPFPRRPVDDKVVSALIAAHDRARAKNGLRPLHHDSRLQLAAQRHADHMARVDRLEHKGIGDGNHLERTQSAGYPGWDVRENIAGNATDAIQVVDSVWMKSPAHRGNILSRQVKDMGAALGITRDGRHYWCAVFGDPTPLSESPMSRRRDIGDLPEGNPHDHQ